MQTNQGTTSINGTNVVISSFPADFFGYFGWPTVGRFADGLLVVAASTYRNAHICPFGRIALCCSNDDGRTWSSPRVIIDTPIDDRDPGIIALDDDTLLVSWCTEDSRIFTKWLSEQWPALEVRDAYQAQLDFFSDETVARWLGSWVCRSRDRGQTWDRPVRVPVFTPHGPIRLRNGDVLYFGKEFGDSQQSVTNGRGWIAAYISVDGGESWHHRGTVPLIPGIDERCCHEPHVTECGDGTLIGMIRVQNDHNGTQVTDAGLPHFSLVQTVSRDGGFTWSQPESLGFHGSPPHLFVHSSGTIVCVYGYRLPSYGERVMISDDGGESWTYDLILRDDGPDGDLGYPSSVELGDGRILTVYYQKQASQEGKCSLLATLWRLP